jgi:uncharacterized glyoxalase superfamily protein PhnB
MIFHLNEHSGSCTPDSEVFVNTNALDNLHKKNISKGCKYNKLEITSAPWDTRVVEVVDPFSNKVVFNEQKNS